MRTLIIVAHMDDEVISCGGLIQQRLSDDGIVKVLVLHSRVYDYGRKDGGVKELLDFNRAMEFIGVSKDNYICYMLQEGEPGRVGYYSLLECIEKELLGFKPDEVIIPSYSDLNQDHKHLNHVCKIALRPDNLQGVTRILVAIGCDGTMQEVNYFIPLTKRQMLIKLNALGCYTTEFRTGFHTRSKRSIKAMLQWYGSKIGCAYAEPYRLYLQKELL